MLTQLNSEQPPFNRAGEMLGFEKPALREVTQRLNTPPEVQLLLACARTVLDDASAERVRILLQGTIDWTYVLEHAQSHRVMSLLYQSLNAVSPEEVPADVLQILRDHASANARYNLYRTGELVKLLRLFESNGITALPFKGPVLSASAYGNLGLREYGDLDVLVRREDVLRTKALLLERGYRLAIPSEPTQQRDFSPRQKDLIFDSADDRVRVELHWRLTGKHFDFPLDLNALWLRLETVSLAGSTVQTLAPQDLLLYLCLHGSRHGWERLLWVCDVAELIRTQPQIDWTSVTAQAIRLGCERMLALGLLLANDLLGAQLPADVWQKLEVDSKVRALVTETSETLFRPGKTGQDIAYWYNLHVRVRERWRDRSRLHLHYWRRYMRLAIEPNERDHEILALPRFLSSLYYLLRPFRLLQTRVSSKKQHKG